MNVLVVNCGSSSLKYQLLDMTTETELAKGLFEKIGDHCVNIAKWTVFYLTGKHI